MIKTDETGRCTLSFESIGVIRRLPVTRYGTSKHGHEWSMQNVLLEVTEEGAEGSATIWLTAWDEELIETLNRIGLNKKVKVEYHIDSRDYLDGGRTSLIIDRVGGITDAEDFLYGTKKKRNNM